MTTAPARSAISPAAATSHGERPPFWTNASNRPFATYASASAALPMRRWMRISGAIRALPHQPAAPDDGQADDVVGERLLGRGRRSARRRGSAGPSAVAAYRSSRAGSRMTPTVGTVVDHQADADAVVRDPVRVVDGAVERVDDPGPPVVRSVVAQHAGVLAGLLGQDRVAGVTRPLMASITRRSDA